MHKLALKFGLVGLAEGDGGGFVVLEVEVDSEGVPVDDLVVDEGLYEGGIGVSSKRGEGESDQPLWVFEVLRRIVGHQNILLELVFAELDVGLLEVGVQGTVQI